MFSLSHRIYVSLCWSPVLPDMLINDVLYWCQVCRIFCGGIFFFQVLLTGEGGGWFLMHCTGNKNEKYDLNWKTFLLFMIPFYINTSGKKNRFFSLKYPPATSECPQKFQPIRSSSLAIFRQRIYIQMSCFIYRRYIL